MDQLTFLSEEPPANPSQLQGLEEEWQTSAVTWRSNILNWLREKGPDGWFGRTCPASCQATEDGTLVPFSGAWSNAGMGSPTECLTLNISEWPKDADVCSLSDTLETGAVAAVLFERESLLGNPAPSREKGEKVAPTISTRIGPSDLGGLGTDEALNGAIVPCTRLDLPEHDVCGTLSDGAHMGGGLNGQDAYSGRVMAVDCQSSLSVRRLTPTECERLQDSLTTSRRSRGATSQQRSVLTGRAIRLWATRWLCLSCSG